MIYTACTKHPEVLSLRWEQFTPHFNDGEECVFRVHEIQVKLNPELAGKCEYLKTHYKEIADPSAWSGRRRVVDYEQWEEIDWNEVGEYEDGYFGPYDFGKSSYYRVENYTDEYLKELVDKSANLHQSNSVMLLCFGDHARVTYSRDGFSLEEYEHY